MSSAEDTERRLAKWQVVDEKYHSLEKYQVNRRRIVFVANDQRRAGGYGIVRRAHLHPFAYLPAWFASSQYGPPQVVAVKEIKFSAMGDVADLKRAFTKEMLVWSSLEAHPGVAKFLGFCADFGRSEAWLISPWEPHGSVSEFIQGRELEVPEKLSLVYDTVDALAFLHRQNPPVCHGDIKSANVLVNAECRAVLCDFGLARLHEDSGFGRLETSTGFKGSIRWCSPELFDGQPRTPNSDVFAWAWLVWEIMTGQLPYGEAIAEYVIMRKIFESPLPQVDGESRLRDCLQVWELMTRCWRAEPWQRPPSAMCRTTIMYLPHCPPAPEVGSLARSPALKENLGELESWKGNHKAALAYLEQALHFYEEEGNDRGVADVLRKQAAVASYALDHVKVMKAASAALEKYKSLNDDVGKAEALLWIGHSFLMDHKDVKALPHLLESLEIFQAKGNDLGVVKCLERLGEIYRCDGRAAEAVSTLEKAVDTASNCGDRLGEARALLVLGDAIDEKANAISTFQRAHDIARSIGWEAGLSSSLCGLGVAKHEQGIQLEAEELLRESVRVARRGDAGSALAQSLRALGECFQAQDRLQEAISALEEAFSIYQDLARGFQLVHTVAALAGAKVAHGDVEGALAWYDKAIAELSKAWDKESLLTCLENKGDVLAEIGRWDEGALHFEASMIIGQEVQDDGSVERNLEKLSGIPKTAIKWEIRRQARLALAKPHLLRTTSLLYDAKKLQLRIPRLSTPNLKIPIRPTNRYGS